jgi:uncharacterized protein
MNRNNKDVLLAANAQVSQGNNEGFLEWCTDDVVWTMVGDRTIRGKAALREWMAAEYREPPTFDVSELVSEGDLLVAIGNITLKNDEGTPRHYAYSDVWRLRDGLLAELKAYVVEVGDVQD